MRRFFIAVPWVNTVPSVSGSVRPLNSNGGIKVSEIRLEGSQKVDFSPTFSVNQFEDSFFKSVNKNIVDNFRLKFVMNSLAFSFSFFTPSHPFFSLQLLLFIASSCLSPIFSNAVTHPRLSLHLPPSPSPPPTLCPLLPSSSSTHFISPSLLTKHYTPLRPHPRPHSPLSSPPSSPFTPDTLLTAH